MKINDLVDKVYLMNMEKREDRLKRSSKQLKNNNIKFQRFNAIDGNNIYNPTTMNAGQWGNYLSHAGILEDCISNGIQKVAIFEDDVEFCDDFENKFALLYPKIPHDWDMIYLGYNKIAGVSTSTENEEIVRITGAYAIHAFILNSNAIRIAHSHFSRTKCQADVYYAQLQNALNVYSFREQLCSQRPDWSDIDEGYVNHRWVFGWE